MDSLVIVRVTLLIFLGLVLAQAVIGVVRRTNERDWPLLILFGFATIAVRAVLARFATPPVSDVGVAVEIVAFGVFVAVRAAIRRRGPSANELTVLACAVFALAMFSYAQPAIVALVCTLSLAVMLFGTARCASGRSGTSGAVTPKELL